MSEEILAIFKADIEQYKAEIAEMGVVNKDAAASTDKVSKSTDKLGKQSRTAATSVGVLSKGLGGIAGLLGITGRLFGVNTDQLQELIFTSQQFSRVAKQLQDVQKASNLATKEGIVIKGADIAASEAQAAANTAALGPIGLLIGAAVALGLAIYNVIGGRKEEADATLAVSEEMIRLNNQLELQIKFQEMLRLRSDESGITLDEYTKSQEALNKALNEEVDRIREALLADEELRNSREGGIDVLKRELAIIKAKAISDKSIFDKEQELRKAELLTLENRQKALGDFASGDLELARDIADKKNEIEAAVFAFQKKEDDKRIALAKKLWEEQLKILDDAFAKAKVKYGKDADEFIKEQERKNKARADFFKKQEDLILGNATIEANLTETKTDDEKARFQSELNSLERQFNAEDKLTEAFQKRKELIEKQHQKNLTDIEKEEDKKRFQERLAAAKQISDAVFQAQQEAFDRKQALLDKEISIQETNIETQRRLAEAGLDNTLAFEERRAAELQRQQQIEAQKQKRIKLLETFLNSLAEFSKTDPKTAIQKALLQVALAQAASAVFAEEGGVIGEIGSRSNLSRRHKGGGDVLLHAQTGEGVLPRDAMSAIGRRNFELLKNAGRHPIRDDVFGMPKLAVANGGMSISNAEVVKELKALQHIVKNKKESTYDLDQFGRYMKTTLENGVNEIVKGKLPKPRFKRG